MKDIKLIWDLYGVLYELKYRYDELDTDESFQDYAKRNIDDFYAKAFEWLADDEREAKENASEA